MENWPNLVNCQNEIWILNFSDKLKDEVFIYGVWTLIVLLKLNKPFKNCIDTSEMHVFHRKAMICTVYKTIALNASMIPFASGLSTLSSIVLGLFSMCLFQCVCVGTNSAHADDWLVEQNTLRTAKSDANPNTLNWTLSLLFMVIVGGVGVSEKSYLD